MRNIILISIYNGEKYLEKQLISIIKSSKMHEVIVVAYDDYSNDDSLNILQSFKNRIHIIFLKYKNFDHVSRNFIYLLNYSVKKFGRNNIFYFCDQDDIWEENKIDITNKLFLESDAPLLLSSVKHFGNEEKVLCPNIHRFIIFDLMFNVAPGMSFAFIPSRFNKDVALLKLFKWHDHGIFLLSKIFGPSPIVSSEVLQYYRRHNNAYMNINKIKFVNRFFYFLSNLKALINISLFAGIFIK